jgi:hypothetical protein
MNKKFLFTTFLLPLAFVVFANCEVSSGYCKKFFTPEYISDGQNYWALIDHDQVAEFSTTFFGGSTYRVAGGAGESGENLIFRIFDEEKNLLFTNQDYGNASYWDFQIENTVTCTIEAQLDRTKQTSGCAVLMIGFKQ